MENTIVLQPRLKSSEGFSLLESIVAMALFLSVLIPLGTIIANALIKDTTGTRQTALHLAEKAVHEAERTVQVGKYQQEYDGFLIETESVREGDLMTINITVTHSKHVSMRPLKLSKVTLVGQ